MFTDFSYVWQGGRGGVGFLTGAVVVQDWLWRWVDVRYKRCPVGAGMDVSIVTGGGIYVSGKGVVAVGGSM